MTEAQSLEHLKQKHKEVAAKLAEMERHQFPDPVVMEQLKHEKALLDVELAEAEGK